MGSTDAGAECALSKDVLLVFVPRPREDAWVRRIESKFPGLQVRWVNRDEYAQDIHKVSDALKTMPAEEWAGVTLATSSIPPPAHFMKSVRFVQLTSAGADRWLEHETYKDPNVIFSTANGLHSTQIAEWVIGVWLMVQHRFIDYAGLMKTAQWTKANTFPIVDSPGLRMGILGYGAIGRQCARLAQALGMEVYAYTRSERSTPESRKDDSYAIPGTGDPDGLIPAKWFHGADRSAINEFLAQDLDVLLVSLPLTASTMYLLDKEQFDILSKKKTYLINIARGRHIRQEALIEALEQGKITGAALDVTDPEPLPADHPLWKAPNIFITPHISWQTPYYWDRVLQILELNLDKLNAGEPLINVMNKKEHY